MKIIAKSKTHVGLTLTYKELAALASSLGGSCAGSIRAFAHRKGWPEYSEGNQDRVVFLYNKLAKVLNEHSK